MLKDLPYSALMQDKLAYEIMLLRDQQNKSFISIGKRYNIFEGRVREIYTSAKIIQAVLYIRHISVALGHKNASKIRKVYNNACECYQDRAYACACLEKRHKKILDKYRGKEPGMPKRFLRSMPPYKPTLSKKTVTRIIEMHEVQKLSFKAIGKELGITQEKAKYTYEWFYKKKLIDINTALQLRAGCCEQQMAILDYCFNENKTYKERYESLKKLLGG